MISLSCAMRSFMCGNAPGYEHMFHENMITVLFTHEMRILALIYLLKNWGTPFK